MKLCTPLLFAAMLSAQQPDAQQPAPAPAGDLASALRHTAAHVDTAFTAQWGPREGPDGPAARNAQGGAMSLSAPLSGNATGSWHGDALLVTFAGERPASLWQVGRHSFVRTGGEPFRAGAVHSDGSPLGFVPDPPLLLRMLAEIEPKVVQRAHGELQDRAVEWVSLALDRQQWERLIDAGAVPENDPRRRMMRMMARRVRNVAQQPSEGLVDVAVALDVKTREVVHVLARTVQKAPLRRVTRGTATTQTSESANDDATPLPEPTGYTNGLADRVLDGLDVFRFELQLRDFGAVTQPPLDESMRRVLGR